MGNKLGCGKKSDNSADVLNGMFCPIQNLGGSDSITIPSKCEAPSFTLSVQGSQKSDSSQHFKWSRMMSLIVEQQHFTEQNLTRASLKLTSQVMDVVKKNLRAICDDVQTGVVNMPDPVLDKFRPLIELKNSNVQPTLPNNVAPLTKKVLTHFVAVIYFHDMILEYFRVGKNNEALELLKQIAVSHALKGVTPLEFRLLDWFLIHFLVKNQLVAEEGINNFVTYLNTVTNHISRFYEIQSIRKTVEVMISEKPDDDRMNKHRENYRIMKKWKNQIEDYKEHEEFVELLLEQNRPDALKGKEESTDTLTLKEKDCIMKHFVKQRRMSMTSSERRNSRYSAFS